MIITSDKNRCVIENMRRINKNYDVVKYWVKNGNNIKLNDEYWKLHFRKCDPAIADVCKHILHTWCHTTKRYGTFNAKYELIPGKLHVQRALAISRIIRTEFVNVFTKEIKEVNIDLNFDELFEKYAELKTLYTNSENFKYDFYKIYTIYGNEEYVVKVHDKNEFKENLKYYFKM